MAGAATGIENHKLDEGLNRLEATNFTADSSSDRRICPCRGDDVWASGTLLNPYEACGSGGALGMTGAGAGSVTGGATTGTGVKDSTAIGATIFCR